MVRKIFPAAEIVLLCASFHLFSLPEDPVVTRGSARIEKKGNRMTLTTSDKTVIRYKDFRVGKGETVTFVQPDASSFVLNRVKKGKASEIFGKIESNGNVILINTDGIHFGPDSQVRCSSFIASTLHLSEENFVSDRFSFVADNTTAYIRNEGTVTVNPGGTIALLAPVIYNSGNLSAIEGHVLLASGENVTLRFANNKLLSFSLEGELKDAVVRNSGRINASGGSITLQLPVAEKAVRDILNTEGIEIGTVFTEQNGKIVLTSESTITADTLSLQGGETSLQGNLSGKEIAIIGKEIRISEAFLDASRPGGEGKIRIGGNLQGEAPLPYATTVSIDEHSRLSVSAQGSGNGGTISIRSSEKTMFSGIAEAGGGELGGNGGTIETSSFGVLVTEGARTDTRALKGTIGTWILDPSVITIASAGGGIPLDCTTTTVLNVAVLEAQASDVVLCANQILQETAISMSVPGVGLTFQSPPETTGTLLLQYPITTSGGKIVIDNMDTKIGGPVSLQSSGAPISLGSIDSLSGIYPLQIDAGGGTVAIGPVGSHTPLGAVTVTASSIAGQSIATADEPILLTGTFTLTENASFTSSRIGSGAAITTDAVEGPFSLTVNAGTSGTVSFGRLGTSIPLGGLLVSQATQVVVKDVSCESGSITILPSVLLTQPETLFSIRNGSSIRLGEIEADIPLIRDLRISGSTVETLILGPTGTIKPLAEVSVSSLQMANISDLSAVSLLVKDIAKDTLLQGSIATESSVTVASTVILLRGVITSDSFSLSARDFLTASGTGQNLAVRPGGDAYINVTNGPLGSQGNPVQLTALDPGGPLIIGANRLAVLSGPPSELRFLSLDPANTPCLVIFNRKPIFNCLLTPGQLWNSLPRSLFATSSFLSQHLGIGTNPLTQSGPYFLSSYFTISFLSRIVNPERIVAPACKPEPCQNETKGISHDSSL